LSRVAAVLRDDVKQMIARGENKSELPGIGPDLAGNIAEIAESIWFDESQR